MDPTTAGLVGGVIGGLLSGGLAALGAVWAYAHGYVQLERNEKRIARIRLVDDLIGSRYALNKEYDVSETDAHYFNRTMARIPYVFAGEKAVMDAYDKFMRSPNDTECLVNLIRKITGSAGIKDGLPDRYVTGVYTISTAD